nr:RNA-directed DNA polymerase, eukaryota [Tanacetum cinerariifolium]
MACSVPHTVEEIKAIIQKQIDEAKQKGREPSDQVTLVMILLLSLLLGVLERVLWEYIGRMINLWEGECVILGYSFTWSHKSASKLSKLDRFIISEGLLSVIPSLSAVCLDKHLSDHRPIFMREVVVDYEPTPFCIFHSWFSKPGFDKLVEDSWSNSTFEETNNISLLKKKFQALKASIKRNGNDDLVNERTTLLKEIQVINACSSLDMAQKAKIHWSIKGDENSQYFNGIVNKKRSQLAIRGILVEGDWIDEHAKKEDLERSVTYDEIKRAVWDCGTNKSPGPDGFTFDFIRRY